MELISTYACQGILVSSLILLALLFWGAPLWLFTVFFALLLLFVNGLWAIPCWALITLAVIAAVFNLFPIRALLISGPVMKLMKSLGILPPFRKPK